MSAKQSAKRVSHRRSLSGTMKKAPGGDEADGGGTPLTPASWVRLHGGTTAIDTILLANNGIAAVKCIRSIRRWAYQQFGDDKAIKVCSRPRMG